MEALTAALFVSQMNPLARNPKMYAIYSQDGKDFAVASFFHGELWDLWWTEKAAEAALTELKEKHT